MISLSLYTRRRSTSRRPAPRWRPALAATLGGALALSGLAPVTAATAAEDTAAAPRTGLVAEYLFDRTAGSSVPNAVAGSVGPGRRVDDHVDRKVAREIVDGDDERGIDLHLVGADEIRIDNDDGRGNRVVRIDCTEFARTAAGAELKRERLHPPAVTQPDSRTFVEEKCRNHGSLTVPSVAPLRTHVHSRSQVRTSSSPMS